MTTNMTADGQATNQLERSEQGSFFSSSFFLRLLAIALVLLTAGASGFWYLTANSPLTLLAGSDRPIAAATAFVPDNSPLTLSLLTRPDKLVALQQAMIAPAKRQQALREVAQIKQSITNSTGLDYDRDIQPWIGNEVTFAFTEPDLDLDSTNGKQAGYLLAMEIAGDRTQQAREFLQFFWQRQSLTGVTPISERISGVRVLYSGPRRDQPASLTAASALVGNQFVLFANDVRTLKRSIRAAQSATNLAQNKKYRQAVAQLSPQRLGLAYLDTITLGNIGKASTAKGSTTAPNKVKTTHPHFIAIGLGITNTGILANARFPMAANSPLNQSTNQSTNQPIEALKFLPASSNLALASDDLTQLAPALSAAGVSNSVLPDFFHLGSRPSTDQLATLKTDNWVGNWAEHWGWASGDYALGRVGAGNANDWILAVERKAEGVSQLDEAALAQGYSTVPVTLGEVQATAWTRFKARAPGRQASRNLESELLALHLQQDGYEIFANSLAALESALDSALENSSSLPSQSPSQASPKKPLSNQLASQKSLLTNERFTQAIAPLSQPNNGYLYADWPVIAPEISRILPIISLIEVAARPFIAHIDTLAATQAGNTASLFIQLTKPVSAPVSRPVAGSVSKTTSSTPTYSASRQ